MPLVDKHVTSPLLARTIVLYIGYCTLTRQKKRGIDCVLQYFTSLNAPAITFFFSPGGHILCICFLSGNKTKTKTVLRRRSIASIIRIRTSFIGQVCVHTQEISLRFFYLLSTNLQTIFKKLLKIRTTKVSINM